MLLVRYFLSCSNTNRSSPAFRYKHTIRHFSSRTTVSCDELRLYQNHRRPAKNQLRIVIEEKMKSSSSSIVKNKHLLQRSSRPKSESDSEGSSSSSSSLDVPLNIRLKHNLANRMDQHLELLSRSSSSKMVEDEFVLVAPSSTTPPLPGSNFTSESKAGKPSSKSPPSQNNINNKENRAVSLSLAITTPPREVSLPPVKKQYMPKPPPSGDGGDWYCSRVGSNASSNNNKKENRENQEES